jgi:hypothetical protein
MTETHYQDMNSNRHAPHAPQGGLLGLRNIIGNGRDLRNPQDSAQTSFRARLGSNNAGRGFEELSSLRDNRRNVGPLIPVAKLLKKVKDLKDPGRISS